MNCPQRLLCTVYVTTSAGLALTAVQEFRHGPLWAAFLFGVAGLVPLVAVVREVENPEPAAPPRRAPRPGPDEIVRASLRAACCEPWWTSCGTQHDAGCRSRPSRRSAA